MLKKVIDCLNRKKRSKKYQLLLEVQQKDY